MVRAFGTENPKEDPATSTTQDRRIRRPANRPDIPQAESCSPKQWEPNVAPPQFDRPKLEARLQAAPSAARTFCAIMSGEPSTSIPLRSEPADVGGRHILIRSRRGAYDSAGRPAPTGTPGGVAASRVQAVAPIAAAPTTANTCRERSEVMVSPERPKVA